jgi:hypothetical protein
VILEGWGDGSGVGGLVVGSVIIIDVYFKSDVADKGLSTLGTLMVMGNACVEGPQDWVVRPIGAVVAGILLTRS